MAKRGSGSSQKGKKGEREFRDLINDAVGDWYQCERIGNPEADKHWLHGDVVLVDDKNEDCILSDYFLESKCQKRPSVWRVLEEAEDNAETYDKKGSICFIWRSSNKHSDKVVAMRPKTFKQLIMRLQGYIEEDDE